MVEKFLNGIHRISNNQVLRSILVKLRYPLGVFLLILFIPHIQRTWFIPGFMISLFGELVQVWSFATLEKNKTLSIRGPYALTRNPMYIGRFFVIGGFLLLAGQVWLIICFVCIYYFYAVNRVKREEKKLQILFGAAYERYCEQVNRFLPSFRAIPGAVLWAFRWKVLVTNHGQWNFLGVLCCYGLFYVFAFHPSLIWRA